MKHWRSNDIHTIPSLQDNVIHPLVLCIFVVNKQFNDGFASIPISELYIQIHYKNNEISNKTVPAQEDPSKTSTILELQLFSQDSLVGRM